VRKKFTGYEKDQETGLDFAQARYYGNGLGRFTSVDPALESIEPTFPQSWNRYAYVLNNPLNLIDPTGLCPEGRECFKDESGEYFIDNGERIYVVYARLFSPPSIREILGGTVTTLPRPTTTTAPKPPYIWKPPTITPITPPSQTPSEPLTPPKPLNETKPGLGLTLFRVSAFLAVFDAFSIKAGGPVCEQLRTCDSKNVNPYAPNDTTTTTTETPDNRRRITLYRGISGTNPGEFKLRPGIDDDGLTFWEDPVTAQGNKPGLLTIQVEYQEPKVPGVIGMVVNPGLSGAIVQYTPQYGAGHWSLRIPGVSNDQFKQILSNFAKGLK
jgi:RHS repeat-associated protein